MLTVINTSLLPHIKPLKLSYFRVTNEGIPYIVLERGSPASVTAHEFQHFRDWRTTRNRFTTAGFDNKTAAKKGPQLLEFTENDRHNRRKRGE